MEEDCISEAELVVLTPSRVDDQTDCERCDEDDLSPIDNQPTDVAEEVEVHYSSRNKDEGPDEVCSSGNVKRKKGDQAKSTHKQRRLENGDKEAVSTLQNAECEESEDKSEAGLPCDICGKAKVRKEQKQRSLSPSRQNGQNISQDLKCSQQTQKGLRCLNLLHY